MALTKLKALHAVLFSVVAISIFAAIQVHNAAKTKAAPPGQQRLCPRRAQSATATQQPAPPTRSTSTATSTP